MYAGFGAVRCAVCSVQWHRVYYNYYNYKLCRRHVCGISKWEKQSIHGGSRGQGLGDARGR